MQPTKTAPVLIGVNALRPKPIAHKAFCLRRSGAASYRVAAVRKVDRLQNTK